jgi:hypothetical protein
VSNIGLLFLNSSRNALASLGQWTFPILFHLDEIEMILLL